MFILKLAGAALIAAAVVNHVQQEKVVSDMYKETTPVPYPYVF